MQWLMAIEWDAVIQIIIIDLLLGGDNAVVIALACRNLPPRLRRRGIFWGAAGAILLRVILITVAVAILNLPLLKLVGGLLLIWIGIKLIAPSGAENGHEVAGADKLWAAIKTIIVADVVMSLDNVLAIAGAAEQADAAQRTGLIIFGLLFSVPFIVFGSQLILRLLDRFPVIVSLGGALLGWIAGGLIVGDSLLETRLPDIRALEYAAGAAGAILVVVAGKWLAARRTVTV